MQLDKFKEALELFRNQVINESKQNLRKIGKGGGTLENSIEGTEVKVTDRSLEFEIKMADYGVFQDKGVKGNDPSKVSPNAKIKGQQAPNSPYRFGSGKTGNWSGFKTSIEQWAKSKNIRLRDEKGRFAKGNYKTIAQIIASNIYNRGIKPSLFFTTPFQKYAKGLPKELETAFALDTEALLAFVTKQQLNNK